MADPVESVLGAGYKKPFVFFMAAVSIVVAVILGLSKIESMVDGRIDIKLAAQRMAVEDHEKRLTKIEEKLGNMTDVLADIRADVKVMRAQLEQHK
jgi:hypothetical protein